MITTPVTTALRATAAAVVVGFTAVTAAGVAYAEQPLTANDHEFLQSLDAAGITFAYPGTAVAFADSVCDAVASGFGYEDLAGAVATTETDLSALSAEQTEILIFDSVYYYCADLLPYLG